MSVRHSVIASFHPLVWWFLSFSSSRKFWDYTHLSHYVVERWKKMYYLKVVLFRRVQSFVSTLMDFIWTRIIGQIRKSLSLKYLWVIDFLGDTLSNICHLLLAQGIALVKNLLCSKKRLFSSTYCMSLASLLSSSQSRCNLGHNLFCVLSMVFGLIL